MSIGPFAGIQGSAAGAPLSQTKGSETEKGQRASAASQRQADAAEKSEKASGIGQTDADEQTSDRDADGRRMHEDTVEIESDELTDVEGEPEVPKTPPIAEDCTGEAGNMLDLSG